MTRFAALATGVRSRWAGHDGALLAAITGLVAAGLLLALAASPSAAARMGFDSAFHFAWRQAAFAAAAVVAFSLAAMLSPRGVRRVGTVLFVLSLVLAAATVLFGAEVKGARRWLDFGPVSLQPTELMKPGFVIVAAWLLSEGMGRPRFPGVPVVLAAFGLAAALLLAQPDVGQTALMGVTMLALVVLSGAPALWTAALLGAAAIAAGGAWLVFPHVRARVEAFIGEGGYQVTQALEAIGAGGLFGRGPGEGTVKDALPDAHSDFIFAVAAEEFGAAACIGLLALFAVLVGRGLARAARLVDPFSQLAAAGLFTMIGLQASIHVAVNLNLLPAKGMTLPFVSYGGSSIIGAALAAGLAFALTRRRPGAFLYDQAKS